jgi:hypothetical protein
MGKNDETKEIEVEEKVEVQEEERVRVPSKMTYKRRLKSQLPEELVEAFAQDGLALRYKPYRIANIVQNSALAELRREGWNFVQSKQLDKYGEHYADYFEVEEFRGRDEMLVAHDLVLMAAPLELIDAINEYNQEQAARELAAVDTNVLEKRGFTTRGSKSTVTHAEPRFRN